MEKRERVIQFLKNNYAGNFIVSETPNDNGKFEVSSGGALILMNKDAESLVSDEFIFTKVNQFFCVRRVFHCHVLSLLKTGAVRPGGLT